MVPVRLAPSSFASIKIRIREVCTGEVPIRKIRTRKVCILKVRIPKACIRKICTIKPVKNNSPPLSTRQGCLNSAARH